MSVNDDLILAKGAYSVTMFTKTSAENYKNVLKAIPGVVTPSKQDEGVKLPTVVDLLRITHRFTFECYITATDAKTAKQVKDDLIKIVNGADVESVPVTLTYEDTSWDVFPEDCVIKKINNDDVSSSYTGKDSAEYHVTLTVIEGKIIE